MSSSGNDDVGGSPEQDDGRKRRLPRPINIGRKPKKHKISCGVKETKLLERLRKMKYWKFPETQGEYKLLMNVIRQHESQFPSWLQEGIRFPGRFSQDPDGDDRTCCKEIRGWVELYLFGDGSEHNVFLFGPGWYGPNHRVDKGDEIELAIRLFPDVLKAKWELRDEESEKYNLLFHLASNTESIHFINRIANLYVEFGMSDQMDIVRLSSELLHNTCAERRLGIEADNALREESLIVLWRLRDDGHVKNEDMGDICHEFLYNTLELDFIKERLLLLIKWNPTLLQPETLFYSNACVSPLIKAFARAYGRFSLDSRELILELYEFVWGQGMKHYPKDMLGFAFHGWNFEIACDQFGDELAREKMNDRITHVLVPSEKEKDNENNKNALQDLMLKAAMDDGMSLDGLYTLIRFDPGAALSRTNQTHSHKNEASK